MDPDSSTLQIQRPGRWYKRVLNMLALAAALAAIVLFRIWLVTSPTQPGWGDELFVFVAPTLLLIAIGLPLATTKEAPTSGRHIATVVLAVVAIAVLSMDIGRKDSYHGLGMFLYLSLPVAASLSFAQTGLARRAPWLVIVATPVIWTVGLFAGCLVTVNSGLVSP